MRKTKLIKVRTVKLKVPTDSLCFLSSTPKVVGAHTQAQNSRLSLNTGDGGPFLRHGFHHAPAQASICVDPNRPSSTKSQFFLLVFWHSQEFDYIYPVIFALSESSPVMWPFLSIQFPILLAMSHTIPSQRSPFILISQANSGCFSSSDLFKEPVLFLLIVNVFLNSISLVSALIYIIFILLHYLG